MIISQLIKVCDSVLLGVVLRMILPLTFHRTVPYIKVPIKLNFCQYKMIF